MSLKLHSVTYGQPLAKDIRWKIPEMNNAQFQITIAITHCYNCSILLEVIAKLLLYLMYKLNFIVPIHGRKTQHQVHAFQWSWHPLGVSSSSPHDKRQNCLESRKALSGDGLYDAAIDTWLLFLSLTRESDPGLQDSRGQGQRLGQSEKHLPALTDGPEPALLGDVSNQLGHQLVSSLPLGMTLVANNFPLQDMPNSTMFLYFSLTTPNQRNTRPFPGVSYIHV